MTLRQDMQPYLNELGLVALTPGTKGRTCDNHLLFTAQYLILLKYLGELFSSDLYQFDTNIGDSLPEGYLMRYPNAVDYCSVDDNIGVGAYMALLSSESPAKAILPALSSSDMVLPPGDFLGRFPGFPPFMRAAAGIKLNIWDQILAASEFLFDCFDKSNATSGRILLLLKSLVYRDQYPIVSLAISIWRKHTYKIFPFGVKSIYLVYFGAHPLTQYAPVNLYEDYPK